jgi:hypothetical protein
MFTATTNSFVGIHRDHQGVGCLMTHKYRGCIVVPSINKIEPNEEQKVLTSSFDQGIVVNASKQVFMCF